MTDETKTLIPATSWAAYADATACCWVSEDRQGSLDVEGLTVEEAITALLAECRSAEQETAILSGSIEIEAVS